MCICIAMKDTSAAVEKANRIFEETRTLTGIEGWRLFIKMHKLQRWASMSSETNNILAGRISRQ